MATTTPAPRGPWAPLRLAVVGLGRVGAACVEALAGAEGLALHAVVRRPGSLGGLRPAALPRSAIECDAGSLPDVDVALLCVPTPCTVDVARGLLSRGVPVVEAAQLHGPAFRAHRGALDREAQRQRRAAVVGAGWDPGALQALRVWLALLAPRGRTTARARTAASLHHTLAARGLPGVRDALCTEARSDEGRLQRYVYLELDPGGELAAADAALRGDPLFLGEETIVLPVESVAALEEADHGVVLERWAPTSRGGEHPRLLLEARFDPVALTAQVMLAAARAVPSLGPGAHGLLDLPPARLFAPHGEAAGEAQP